MPDIRTVELTRALVDKHKAKVRYLSHVRINNKTKGFAAFIGNDLVGVVNTEEKNAKSIWIQALEVSKEYQKQGIGKTLLDMAMKRLHANFLSVRKTNKVAIEMYKKKGFRIADETGVMYIMTTLPSGEDFEEGGEPLTEISFEEVHAVMRGLTEKITSDQVGIDSCREFQEDVDIEPQMNIYCETGSDGVEHFCVEESFMEASVREKKVEAFLYRLIAINMELNDFQYGIFYNGKVLNGDGDDYDHYRYLSPEEFYRVKTGICWDFVAYQTDHLKKIGIDNFMNYYVELLDTEIHQTHTFTIVTIDEKYMYLESSYQRIKGVWLSTDVDKLIDFVVSNMIFDAVSDMKRANQKVPQKITYGVTRYKEFTNYGCDVETFMNSMRKFPLVRQEKWDVNKKVKTPFRPSQSNRVIPNILLESGDEFFMEDAVGKTRILRDCVEKRIFDTLNDPQKNRAYRKIINDFIERNMEKLVTAGPVYLIVFGDEDQAMYFNLFGIQKQEVVDAMVKLTTMAEKKSDFKYLRNNPIYVVLYYCIRYFTMKNDQKGLNMTLSIYALAVYWSIFTKYFPKGVIEPVMQYTIDNLTDKFLIKKSKHIFGTLVESITRSYNFHKPRIRVGNDDDAVSWIQRIRNDQNSLIKKVATEYMKNWKAGNAVTTRNDGYDSDAPILDSNENATSMIQNHVSKVTLPIIANGVDILFAEAAAKMAQISVSDCRQYLVKIMVQKNLETLERFVESILFLFIYEEQHSLREIRSEYFMAWAQSLFKKTNSKNKNINRINEILEKWAEESGIYERFRREGSRINYKKAIFFYVVMSIQKYS